MMIVKFLFRRLLMVFLMILKEISCEEFKLKFKVQELEIQGSGVGDSRFRSWRFKVQELEEPLYGRLQRRLPPDLAWVVICVFSFCLAGNFDYFLGGNLDYFGW